MYDRMTMQIVYDIVGNGEGGGREARFQSAIIVDILDLDYVVSSVFGGGGVHDDDVRRASTLAQ